jgi:flagellin
MALSINHNFQSEFTQLNLNRTQMGMNSSLEKLSSGYRINSAKDDASGLFIADQLKLVADALDQGSRNALTGISTAQIAESSLSQVYDKLKDMYTKAQDAANDVNDSVARQALQTDIQKLTSAIDTIAKTSEYNGINLLDGTFTNKSIHYGARADQTTTISIQSARATELGASVVNGNGTTGSNATNYAGLLAAKTDYAFDTNDKVDVAGVDLSGSFANGDATDAKTIADAVNNDGTLQSLGVSATAKNGSTADAEFGVLTVAAGDTLTLNFYAGKDSANAVASLSLGNGAATDQTYTLDDIVSMINTDASANGSSLNAKAEYGKLVISTDGETIGVEANLAGGGTTSLDMNKLLQGATGTVAAATEDQSAMKVGDLNIVGSDAYQSDFTGLTSATTGLGLASGTIDATNYNLNAIDVTTNAGAELALSVINVAIKTVDSQRADLGSKQIEFQALIDNNDFSATQTREAESRIRNVDFAKEMSQFTLKQTQMQAGMAMLSQANQIPSMVLQLLR